MISIPTIVEPLRVHYAGPTGVALQNHDHLLLLDHDDKAQIRVYQNQVMAGMSYARDWLKCAEFYSFSRMAIPMDMNNLKSKTFALMARIYLESLEQVDKLLEKNESVDRVQTMISNDEGHVFYYLDAKLNPSLHTLLQQALFELCFDEEAMALLRTQEAHRVFGSPESFYWQYIVQAYKEHWQRDWSCERLARKLQKLAGSCEAGESETDSEPESEEEMMFSVAPEKPSVEQ